MEHWIDKLVRFEPGFVEIGNIWSQGNNLHLLIKDFIQLLKNYCFDTIATIETKGIIYAAALAYKLELPLIIFRKKGKLFYTEDKYQFEFQNWRNNIDGIEIEKNHFNIPKNILVVDDLAEKLNTFKAVHAIISNTNCSIVAYLCFCNISGENEIFGKEILSLLQKPEYYT